MAPTPREVEQQAIEQSCAEVTWFGTRWHTIVQWRVRKLPPPWGFAQYADFTRLDLIGRCLFLQSCVRHYGVSTDLALRWVVPLAVFAGAVVGLMVGRR